MKTDKNRQKKIKRDTKQIKTEKEKTDKTDKKRQKQVKTEEKEKNINQIETDRNR